jgi:L-arabinose isomerase
MKVVINKCYGGYRLSRKAYKELNLKWDGYGLAYEDDRSNPELVKAVEKLGKAASGDFAELYVVEMPDDVIYEIDDYDGAEIVREEHRVWGR